MKLFFKILAVVLIGTAAVLLSQQQREYAFAAAVLSICAFFLSMRSDMKSRISEIIAERQPAPEEAEEAEEEDDDELGQKGGPDNQ